MRKTATGYSCGRSRAQAPTNERVQTRYSHFQRLYEHYTIFPFAAQYVGAPIQAAGATCECDFSWEPTPNGVRFSNFYDTTTYFFLLALLPMLESDGVVSADDAADIADGLLRYVTDSLLESSEEPCIRVHECAYETRRKILPAVWNSSAYKAALLARFLDSGPQNTWTAAR